MQKYLFSLVKVLILLAIVTSGLYAQGTLGIPNNSIGGTTDIQTKFGIHSLFDDVGLLDGGVNKFTGDVAFSITLEDISLSYNGNVRKIIAATNDKIQSGWIGVGWSLTMGNIFADNNSTVDLDDDKYYITTSEGFSSELFLKSGSNNGFYLKDHKNWKITRYLQSDGKRIKYWEVITEDGISYYYGEEKSSDISEGSWFGSDNSRRCNLAWDNWIGDGNDDATDIQVPYQWDLSSVKVNDIVETEVSYQQEMDYLYGVSDKFTRASYLNRISYPRSGKLIQFVSASRNANEWKDPYPYAADDWTINNMQVDGYQERYETKYLSEIQVKINSTLYQKYVMSYESFECGEAGDNKYKRFLTEIIHKDKNNQALPSHKFEYIGINDGTDCIGGDCSELNRGALVKVTYPTGGKTEFEYENEPVLNSVNNKTLYSSEALLAYESALTKEHWVMIPYSQIGEGTITDPQLCAFHWNSNSYDYVGTLDSDPNIKIVSFHIAGTNTVNHYVPLIQIAGDVLAVLSPAYKYNPPSNDYSRRLYIWHWTGKEWTYKQMFEYFIDAPMMEDRLLVENSKYRERLIVTKNKIVVLIPENILICDDIRDCEIRDPEGDLIVLHRQNDTWTEAYNNTIRHGYIEIGDGASAGGPPFNLKFLGFCAHVQIASENIITIENSTVSDYAKIKNLQWNGTTYNITELKDSGNQSFNIYNGFIFFDGYLPKGTANAPIELFCMDNKIVMGYWSWKSDPGAYAKYLKAWHWDGNSWNIKIDEEITDAYIGGWYNQDKILADNEKIVSISNNGDVNEARIKVWHWINENSGWQLYGANGIINPGANEGIMFVEHNRDDPSFSDANLFISKDFIYVQEPAAFNTQEFFIKTWRWDGTNWTFIDQYDDYSFYHPDFYLGYAAIVGNYDDKITIIGASDNNLSQEHTIVTTLKWRGNYTKWDLTENDIYCLRCNGVSFFQGPDRVIYNDHINGNTECKVLVDYNESWADTANDFRVTSKITIDGFDNLSTTEFSYENNGVFDTDQNSAKYNKVTVEYPGGMDSKATYFYNDLPPDIVNGALEFVNIENDVDRSKRYFLQMDGKVYREKAYEQGEATPFSTTHNTYRVEEMQGSDPSLNVSYDIRTSESESTKDGVTSTTNMSYNSLGQLSQVKETNSDGTERTTITLYAHAMTSGDEPIYDSNSDHVSDMGPLDQNRLSLIAKTTVYDDDTSPFGAVSSVVTTYKDWGNGYLPEREYVWSDEDPASFMPGFDSWLSNQDPDPDDWIKKGKIEERDQYSNIIEYTDANETPSAIKWGFKKTLPLAFIQNAEYNETFYEGFDEYIHVGNMVSDGPWIEYYSGQAYPLLDFATITNDKKLNFENTSTSSWKGLRTNLNTSLSSLVFECEVTPTNTSNIFYVSVRNNSGYVALARFYSNGYFYAYSNGSFGNSIRSYTANTAYQIKFEINTGSDQWYLYVNGEKYGPYGCSVSGAVSNITYFDYKSSGAAIIDRVRLYPIDAQCASISYDPATLKASAATNENGVSTYYEYDTFGRLDAILNNNHDLISEAAYYYSRDDNTNFNPSSPNNMTSIKYDGNGNSYISKGYYDGLGRSIQTQQQVSDQDIIAAVDYDELGRPHLQWKPYSADTDHKFTAKYDDEDGINGSAKEYYDGNPGPDCDNYPFTENLYRNAFGEDIDKIGNPGTVFSTDGTHTIRKEYGSNLSSDVPGYSTANTLYKMTTYDENGNSTELYIDKFGNTVFNKTFVEEPVEVALPAKTVSAESETGFPPDTDTKTFTVSYPQDVHWSCSFTIYGSASGTFKIYDQANPGTTIVQRTSNGSGDFQASPGITYVMKADAPTPYAGYIRITGSAICSTRSGNIIRESNTAFEYDITGSLEKVYPPNYFDPPHGTASDWVTSYTYNTLGQFIEKHTPDAGIVKYLYDKNGNLRFTQDANNLAGVGNSVNKYGSSSSTTNGSFEMDKYGLLNWRLILNVGTSTTLQIKDSDNNIVFQMTSSTIGQDKNGEIYIKQGSYTYSVTVSGYPGIYYYELKAFPTAYSYTLYDALNRPIETGEYQGSSSTFTQSYANNVNYPTTDKIAITKNYYDNSTINGQHNLKGRLSKVEYMDLNSGSYGTTYYSYTNEGWIEWIIQDLPGSEVPTKKIEYVHDLQGKVTQICYNPGQTDDYYFWYDYNQLGQLERVYSAAGSTKPPLADVVYAYGPTGQVSVIKLGEYATNSFREILNYQYTVRDWLSSINAPTNIYSPTGKFAMRLYYDSLPLGASTLENQYNGNIVATEYYTNKPDQGDEIGNPKCKFSRYLYTYDDINRLKSATFQYYKPWVTDLWESNGAYNVPEINYDLMGNMDYLIRYNQLGSGTAWFYNYQSGTNKLTGVTNLHANKTTNYTYDTNGNLVKDISKLASGGKVNYDYRNLPDMVKDDSGNMVYYAYDQTGVRISKKYTIDGDVETAQYYIQDASGQTIAVYDKDGVLMFINLFGMDQLGKAEIDGASVDKKYYIKDHLGNIRLTLGDDGLVKGYDDYYPFGLQMPGRCNNTANPDHLYKYSSKQLDEEQFSSGGLDWYYFGARYYDPEIGRWLAVDPLADQYPSFSPYVYCANSPLIFIDPNGMSVYAKSDEERNTILNTLSENERKYVQFNDDGLLDTELLNQNTEGGGNFTALSSLANSEDVYEVLLTDKLSISGKEYEFGDITVDPDFEGGYAHLSTNETGWTGQTISKEESNNGNIQISINKNLSEAGRAETLSHEGYGHAYFMSIGKNPDHIYLKTDQPFIFKEGNLELKNQIIERMSETRKNMGH